MTAQIIVVDFQKRERFDLARYASELLTFVEQHPTDIINCPPHPAVASWEPRTILSKAQIGLTKLKIAQ